ncbi:MAG: hypothetical protein ACTHOH_02090 [Lysobacteraceae bacterium]
MSDFRELDGVRVLSVEGVVPWRDFGDDARLPRIGDVATVVKVLHAPGHPDGFECECVDGHGRTLWWRHSTPTRSN